MKKRYLFALSTVLFWSGIAVGVSGPTTSPNTVEGAIGGLMILASWGILGFVFLKWLAEQQRVSVELKESGESRLVSYWGQIVWHQGECYITERAVATIVGTVIRAEEIEGIEASVVNRRSGSLGSFVGISRKGLFGGVSGRTSSTYGDVVFFKSGKKLESLTFNGIQDPFSVGRTITALRKSRS